MEWGECKKELMKKKVTKYRTKKGKIYGKRSTRKRKKQNDMEEEIEITEEMISLLQQKIEETWERGNLSYTKEQSELTARTLLEDFEKGPCERTKELIPIVQSQNIDYQYRRFLEEEKQKQKLNKKKKGIIMYSKQKKDNDLIMAIGSRFCEAGEQGGVLEGGGGHAEATAAETQYDLKNAFASLGKPVEIEIGEGEAKHAEASETEAPENTVASIGSMLSSGADDLKSKLKIVERMAKANEGQGRRSESKIILYKYPYNFEGKNTFLFYNKGHGSRAELALKQAKGFC